MTAPNEGLAKWHALRKEAIKLGIPAKGKSAELAKAIKAKRAAKGKSAPKKTQAPKKTTRARTDSDGAKLYRKLQAEARKMGLKTTGNADTIKRRIAAAKRSAGASPSPAPRRTKKRERNGLFWNLYQR